MNLSGSLEFYRSHMNSERAERIKEFRALPPKDRDELAMHMLQHLSAAVEHLLEILGDDVGMTNLADGEPRRQ